MKFSVKDPAFPYFEALKCSAYELHIEVDGEEQRDAIAFDTVEGWVDRHVIGPNGQVVVMKNGDIATERVRGVVIVRKRA